MIRAILRFLTPRPVLPDRFRVVLEHRITNRRVEIVTSGLNKEDAICRALETRYSPGGWQVVGVFP